MAAATDTSVPANVVGRTNSGVSASWSSGTETVPASSTFVRISSSARTSASRTHRNRATSRLLPEPTATIASASRSWFDAVVGGLHPFRGGRLVEHLREPVAEAGLDRVHRLVIRTDVVPRDDERDVEAARRQRVTEVCDTAPAVVDSPRLGVVDERRYLV